MNFFDTIIIGGGPAGLFTAINAIGKSSEDSKINRVLLLEKNTDPGKKLLISGSGRCNITHSGSIEDFFVHYGVNHRFLQPALRQFTNIALINFLWDRGVDVVADKYGKVFPKSQESRDILNLLIRECHKKSVIIHTDEPVNTVVYRDNKFQIICGSEEYSCNKLCIATGGKSYPNTGSTGDGFKFAESLGHTIVKPTPALAPAFIKDYRFSGIAGVTLHDVEIFLYRDNKKINETQGDLLFTHSCLSGPGILDFSRYFQVNDTLKINFVNTRPDDFLQMFLYEAENKGNTSIKHFIRSFEIPASLVESIFQELNMTGTEQLANINKTLRSKIIELFSEYPFVIKRLSDYNMAMATSGGVSLKEVSPKTMESKLVKNLFFAGEVLDIDGDTGGYNLQAAFSTGYVAGRQLRIEN